MRDALELLFSKLWPWLGSVCAFFILAGIAGALHGMAAGLVRVSIRERKW